MNEYERGRQSVFEEFAAIFDVMFIHSDTLTASKKTEFMIEMCAEGARYCALYDAIKMIKEFHLDCENACDCYRLMDKLEYAKSQVVYSGSLGNAEVG